MEYRLFIDGIWQLSESGQTYTNVDPANPDEVLGKFQKGNEAICPLAESKFSRNNRKWGPEGINEFTELKNVYIEYENSEQKNNPLRPDYKVTFGTP